MTWYILAGGADRSTPGYADKLSKSVKSFIAKDAIRILSCQFSQDEDSWQAKVERWAIWFRQYFGQDTKVQLATQEGFIDQINWADVIYLHGGDTQKMKAILDTFQNLEDHFKDKVVIGSSAGTNYLSKTYFTPALDAVETGSGILPVNTIVHYGAEGDGEVSMSATKWANVLEKMKNVVGSESIILLPEGDFVVIEK